MRFFLISSWLSVAAAVAREAYQWPELRKIEYATARALPDKVVTYARPYASLASLVPNRTTTTWPSGATASDHENPYGRAAHYSLWADIVVTKGPFSTTVKPTPLPSAELVKPPPLLLDTGKGEGKFLTFPKDIAWGFAGAALQIEGAIKDEGRGPSVWEGRANGSYPMAFGGSPDVAAMNYYLYKQDIVRMASLGVDSYSFSISWPRIVPFGVAGSPINKQGIDHYNDLINTIIKYGMKPVVTLAHWDSPLYYLDNGVMGLNHPEFVEGFMYYAKTVIAQYADRVGTWYTFNEPTIEGNAIGNWTYSKTVLTSHASIVRWYRDEVKGTGLFSMKMEQGDGGFAVPLNPSNPEDAKAATRRNEFAISMFAYPLFYGENAPQTVIRGLNLPVYTKKELALFKGTADFFAFDVYTATFHSAPEGGVAACDANEKHPNYPFCSIQHRGRNAAWQENFYGDSDRIALPADTARSMLGYYHHTYPTKHGITVGEFGLPPLFATNMTAEQQAIDPAQSNFYIPILQEMLKAINYDGVKMKGVFGWSYLDNWEWGQYKDRYGVQMYNSTTMERRFKRAIFDYSDFMQHHTATK